MLAAATEYRDPWRGLRILVPRGWRVRRSCAGIFLHDEAATQAVAVQPRPGVKEPAALRQDLLAWLRRTDAEARVWAGPQTRAAVQFVTAQVRVPPGEPWVGVFALQAGEHDGLITGFAARVEHYDAASRIAVAALASLASTPLQPRRPWLEPTQQACSALVPEGWAAKAVLRRANASGLAQAAFEAWGADAASVTATAEARLFAEPGLRPAVLGWLAGGLAGRGRFVDAAGYAERHLLPALRKEAAQARLEAVIPRPDLIPAAVAQEAASAGVSPKEVLQAEPSAADAVFSLKVRGRELRQVTRVLTMHVPPPLARGLPLWLAASRHAYRAPVEALAACEPVLEGVALSFREDAAWRAREQARVAAQLRRRAEVGTAPDADGLLAEAESLMGTWSGRPLALYERMFAPAGPEPIEANLYDQAPWRQA